MSGAGFGAGLKAGLIGGGLAAAFGGVSGGLIRGFTDMAKGYSFWDGSKTSNFVIGSVEQQSGYKVNAKNYNNSGTYVESNEVELKARMLEEFGVSEGDIGIERITTKAGNGLGMTSDGIYVDNKGNTIGGITKRFSTGKTLIRISPKYAVNNMLDFQAIAGHELIHAYHYYAFGNTFNSSFSESVAYRYSVGTYVGGRNMGAAFSMYKTAIRLNSWGYYPDSYTIPKSLRYSW